MNKIVFKLLALAALIIFLGMLFLEKKDQNLSKKTIALQNLKTQNFLAKTKHNNPPKITLPKPVKNIINFKEKLSFTIPPPVSNEVKTGLLYNISNNHVLWSKNAEKAVPIASMTKLITALVIYDELKKNPKISLQTKISVSKKSAGIGGRQVYLATGEQFTIDKLLQAMLIHSANDASYQLAEFFGKGNVQKFLAKMNKKARTIGMKNSRFYNPHGLPGRSNDNIKKENVASAIEMISLAIYYSEIPFLLHYTSSSKGVFREKKGKKFLLTSSNKLLNKIKGIVGLKTGYTKKAGFCSTVLYSLNGLKLAVVVTGFKKAKHRDTYLINLIKWALKNSKNSKH